jgi:TolB-like protein
MPTRIAVLAALASLGACVGFAWAQAPAKPQVAVLEFQAVGATPAESAAITDRLRQELLRAGKVKVVERAQMDALLAAKAEKQAACSGPQCADTAKLLGVRFMISGKVVKFAADAWQVSATLVDVESAQTLKAESVREKGDIGSVLDKAIPVLAARLGG